MSIDARISHVTTHEGDNGGELHLLDRPARPGGYPGNRGQPTLSFDDAPHEVTALNGLDVWGGATELMLGERKIADRLGYTRIAFVPRGDFLAAVAEYHERERQRRAKPA